MATGSEVRQAADEIDNGILIQTRNLKAAKAAIGKAAVALGSYNTQFADYIATVNSYTPTGEAEALQKSILTSQIAEFSALKGAAQSAVDLLAPIEAF